MFWFSLAAPSLLFLNSAGSSIQQNNYKNLHYMARQTAVRWSE